VNHLVGEADPVVARQDLHQFLLDLFGRLGLGEFKAARDAEDVRVDHDAFGQTVADAEDDVGGFAGGAGDGDELGECLRDLAVEVGENFAGSALNGFGFVAEEAGGLDKGFEFGQSRFGHIGRGRKAAKELGRDHVDAHISALRGKDGGDEQLPRRAVSERADGVGVGFVEGLEDGGDAGLTRATWGERAAE